MAFAASLPSASSTSPSTTRAPSPTKSFAASRPCPRAPPVMNATLPSRRPITGYRSIAASVVLSSSRPSLHTRLDTQPLCQQLAVVGRVAEHQLVGLRAPVIEMGVVLPREADAAVH